MNIRLFTHNDLDAIGCDLVTRIKYGKDNVKTTYHTYLDINEYIIDFVVRGNYSKYDKVIIADISVDYVVAELINSKEDLKDKIVLIDHHINDATLKLKEFDFVILKDVFNNEFRSATYLLAVYLKVIGYSTYTDNVIELIDNFDTWKWEEKGTFESIQLNDLYNSLKEGELLDYILDVGLPNFKNKHFSFEGKLNIILDVIEEEKKRILDRLCKTFSIVEYKEYKIGVVYCSKYISELGNKLALFLKDKVDLVALINLEGNSISLRTIREDIHLGNIAKELGAKLGLRGGGHPRSAGISMTSDFKNEVKIKILNI